MATKHYCKLTASFPGEQNGNAACVRLFDFIRHTDRIVRRYNCAIVKDSRSNVFAEFDHMVDGVNCALEIQDRIYHRNCNPSESKREKLMIQVKYDSG